MKAGTIYTSRNFATQRFDFYRSFIAMRVITSRCYSSRHDDEVLLLLSVVLYRKERLRDSYWVVVGRVREIWVRYHTRVVHNRRWIVFFVDETHTKYEKTVCVPFFARARSNKLEWKPRYSSCSPWSCLVQETVTLLFCCCVSYSFERIRLNDFWSWFFARAWTYR